jgi:OOP family OmpA-OmpF porin
MTYSDVTRLLNLLTLVLIPLAPLAAQAEEGEWYVSPSIAYTDDDPDRKVDDSFSGGQVQVGREMGEHLWLEGLFGYHDIDGFPGQEHVGTPDFGGLPPADSTASNATATGGLGLKVRFGDSPWSLRAEWRLRHAFDSDNSLTDQVGSIGIQYNFGGGSAAPMVAASEPEPDTGAGIVAAAPADSDGDGVANDRDQCPGTPAGVKVDASGCEIVSCAPCDSEKHAR